MNINNLIAIVKKKLEDEIVIEKIDIEDKSYLHKNHSGYKDGKFHLKLKISSIELKKLSQIDSSRKVFKILDQEVKEHIHSLQILIN
jgi:BolA protein